MIHQHYFPEMSGTARRTKELAESFIKMGHQISVVTYDPNNKGSKFYTYKALTGKTNKAKFFKKENK